MTAANEHTPGPWFFYCGEVCYERVERDENGHPYPSPDRVTVDGRFCETDLRYIVAAMNNHAALRDALQRVRDAWQSGPSHESAHAAIQRVREVLSAISKENQP